MILLFDSSGGLLEFELKNNLNLTNSYFSPVSVGLIESNSIFIFEEYWNTVKNEKVSIRPLPENGHTRKFKFSWLERVHNQIYLYDVDFNTNLITVLDELIIDCNDDLNTQWSGFTNSLPTTLYYDESFLQINVALSSDIEESLSRTLIITEIIDTIESEICRILFYGETEGEDDRYKVLVKNFRGQLNIDDSDSVDAFRKTNIEETNPDHNILNEKRKELVIAGNEIIPYLGSYKGLINAINYFGYSDLRIREYWLNIDESSINYKDKFYVNVRDAYDGVLNTSYNILPPDRFKKTSLFGLFYDLNRETGTYDEYGTPEVEDVDLFSPEEVIIKLFALQRKLKSDFLPLNAKIIDIVGEGVYFKILKPIVWLSELNNIGLDKFYYSDFNIQSPLGNLQQNTENNIKDFIYDLRPLLVKWNTFDNFNEISTYPINTIINHQSNMWLSNSTILGGPFNTSKWTKLSGINSLYNIDSSNPVYSGVPLESFKHQLVSYFNETKADVQPYEWPDDLNIPAGCPIILTADYGGLDWDDADVEWDSLYGDLKSAADYDSSNIYQVGFYTRYVGRNWKCITITTGIFDFSDWIEIQSTSYSWNTIDTTDYYEMEWIVKDDLGKFKFNLKGLVNSVYDINDKILVDSIQSIPLTLPYIGKYTVELRTRSLFNDTFYKQKKNILEIKSKSAEFVCFSYFLDDIDGWDETEEESWDDVGAVWQLPAKEYTTWDNCDINYNSTDFAKYRNNMPKNSLGYFGYESYYWDNFPYNDWEELGSTTWGMLDEISDDLGGFNIKINGDDFTTFNSTTNFITIGPTTYEVDITINSYTDLINWLRDKKDKDFIKFNYNILSINGYDCIKASAKFVGEYGYYKNWELEGYYGLNNQGAVTISGSGWNLIWNSDFIWDVLDQSWNEESPIYDSMPELITDAGQFILPPINIYNEAFKIWTLVPIFIVPDNCTVPGKHNFHWEIWDHERNIMLFQIDHPFIIWTFTTEGIYSIKMSCYDSNGNFVEDEKRGWIQVNTKSQVNSILREQRVDAAINNPLIGIEFNYVIQDGFVII